MSRNFLDEDETSELRAEDRARKYYNQALSRHPDCRDPDHPGCSECEDGDGTEECDDCCQPIEDCYCEDYQDIEES